MNCGTCTECKIKMWVFEKLEFWSFPFLFFRFVRKCFGFFGVFVKGIVVFNIEFGFFVLNSIWEHGLKIFFDLKKSKKSTPKIEKNPRSVNNFRTKHLGDILGFLERRLQFTFRIFLFSIFIFWDYFFEPIWAMLTRPVQEPYTRTYVPQTLSRIPTTFGCVEVRVAATCWMLPRRWSKGWRPIASRVPWRGSGWNRSRSDAVQ